MLVVFHLPYVLERQSCHISIYTHLHALTRLVAENNGDYFSWVMGKCGSMEGWDRFWMIRQLPGSFQYSCQHWIEKIFDETTTLDVIELQSRRHLFSQPNFLRWTPLLVTQDRCHGIPHVGNLNHLDARIVKLSYKNEDLFITLSHLPSVQPWETHCLTSLLTKHSPALFLER